MKTLEIKGRAPALIVAAMGRSGTSYSASMLQQAGVDIGSRLMGASKGNTKGHFENLDFVMFHSQVLEWHGLDSRGWNAPKAVAVPESFVQHASRLVQENSRITAWGFKDPRTCLFLDFWQAMLPSANFLCIFRSPWEVLSSLVRRGTDLPLLEKPQSILDCWENYNSSILELCRTHKSRTILFDINTLTLNWEQASRAISEKFNIPLRATIESCFEPNMLTRKPYPAYYAELIEQFFPSVDAVWKDLKRLSAIPVDEGKTIDKPDTSVQRLILDDVVNHVRCSTHSMPDGSDPSTESSRLRQENQELHDEVLRVTESLIVSHEKVEQATISKERHKRRAQDLESARQILHERCEELEGIVARHELNRQALNARIATLEEDKYRDREAITTLAGEVSDLRNQLHHSGSQKESFRKSLASKVWFRRRNTQRNMEAL